MDEGRVLDEAQENAQRVRGVPVEIWAIVATFGAYFCMYMFRKPFTSASFESMTALGMAFKPLAVISQVLGYTLSKFIGIKVVSEASPGKRVLYFLVMIGVAEIALVLFGLTPAPYNLVWLFLNGLPLGMVFGMVLSYLEGRARTEILTASLCASFIVADGVAKTSGTWLMQQGVSESWMPAGVGALYLPAIALFAWMLSQIPGQSKTDIELRAERKPMDKEARRSFFKKYAVGLTLLVLIYSLVGVLRGVRGDFAKEIWEGLNYKVDAASFSTTEIIIAFAVLAVIAFLVFIKDNGRAFQTGLAMAACGMGVVVLSLVGQQLGWVNPYAFMVLIGFGLYVPYIAIHATVFERLVAYTKEPATIGYLMYVADAVSYAMLVGLLLFKNLGQAEASKMLPFFLTLAWVVAGACLLMLWPASHYFRTRRQEA
jgi:hypothetical protein